jgi:hypothetical protein
MIFLIHFKFRICYVRDLGGILEIICPETKTDRDLIFVFSGPKTKIEGFFNSNPGISSRIGNHVDFEDYNVGELTAITKFLLNNENRYKFTDETIKILVFYIEQQFPHILQSVFLDL